MTKNFIKICVWVTFLITTFIAILFNISTSLESIKRISFIPAISQFIIIIYCKYLWKVKFLNFKKIINLNGKWECVIKYNFEGKERQKTCDLEIEQDLFGIKIKMKTDETKSSSVMASIEQFNDYAYLTYVYKTETNREFREGNRDQYGAVKLLIEENKMTGEYWTNNKTDGTMILIKK